MSEVQSTTPSAFMLAATAPKSVEELNRANMANKGGKRQPTVGKIDQVAKAYREAPTKEAKQAVVAAASAAADAKVASNVAALAQGRPVGKRTHPMPSKLAANAAKTAKEEAEARTANEAKLAAMVRKQAPAKVLATGSGALVGVAAGATDHQPHTKRAVEQARAKARLPEPVAKAVKEAKAPAKAPKAKAAVPAADRKYKVGPKPYKGKEGSWTYYMITHVLKYKSTAQAVAAQSQFKDKRLDFKWMAEVMGYITFI